MGIFTRAKVSNPTILAATGSMAIGGRVTAGTVSQAKQNWQRKVMAFKDAVPEVGHAGKFVRNVTDKVVLYTGDKTVDSMLEEFPLGFVCENIFFIGECLVGITVTDNTPPEWEAFGIGDYEVKQKQYHIRNAQGKFEERPDTNFFRVWNPDSAKRLDAYSTHKGVLDVVESMYYHQLADMIVGKSRMQNAGILFIPNNGMSDVPDFDGANPEPGSQQEFEMVLRQAMDDAIRMKGNDDSTIAPLIMFGDAEIADGLRHVLLERSDDAQGYSQRMDRYVKRYGDGIDIPSEVVTGMGDANHWSSWKVDANTWQYYIEPMVSVVAQALSKHFTEALGYKVVVQADGKEAIMKPDKTDAAIRLHSVGALSAEGALHYAGMEEEYLHPNANQDANPSLGYNPDGSVRMPSSNYRGSEGTPVSDRNFER